MNTSSRNPEALLPLKAAMFHILVALAAGERHGYGILQDVAARTNCLFPLGTGTLYRSIKEMLATGLIEEFDERSASLLEDEPRRYYRLTAWGRQVAQAEARRLHHLVRLAEERHLLDLPEAWMEGSGA